jgi:hypothetical protein
VGSKKDLTTTFTEVTKENTAQKSLLLQSTTSLCLLFVGSVFLVVKSFAHRCAGQPLGRLAKENTLFFISAHAKGESFLLLLFKK